MGFQKHKTKEQKELRKAKYTLLRAVGFNEVTARRLRDWRLNCVIKVLYHKPKHLLTNQDKK